MPNFHLAGSIAVLLDSTRDIFRPQHSRRRCAASPRDGVSLYKAAIGRTDDTPHVAAGFPATAHPAQLQLCVFANDDAAAWHLVDPLVLGPKILGGAVVVHVRRAVERRRS